MIDVTEKHLTSNTIDLVRLHKKAEAEYTVCKFLSSLHYFVHSTKTATKYSIFCRTAGIKYCIYCRAVQKVFDSFGAIESNSFDAVASNSFGAVASNTFGRVASNNFSAVASNSVVRLHQIALVRLHQKTKLRVLYFMFAPPLCTSSTRRSRR